jgi:hypothetical protein
MLLHKFNLIGMHDCLKPEKASPVFATHFTAGERPEVVYEA